MSKMKWGMLILFAVGFGAIGLYIVFPEQVQYILNPASMWWYLTHVEAGGGFSRISAFSIISNDFFEKSEVAMLFGLGTGSAERLSFGGMEVLSDVARKFPQYAYYGFSHAMIYAERGVFGLIWYIYLFWYIFKSGKKVQANLAEKDTVYCLTSRFTAIIVALLFFKDSTLKISGSGYLIFLILSIPLVLSKTSRRKS